MTKLKKEKEQEKTPTVLIVDDDLPSLELLQAYLEDIECETVLAHEGPQALKIIDKTPPDLVLLDVMMPKMNGWVLYDIIKSNTSWRNIPIVFLTVRKDKLAMGAGELLGDGYITKPFESEELVNGIDKVLNKY